MDNKDFVKFSFNNKQAVQESETCGCWNCFSTFSSHDITSWTDYGKTALCPNCELDFVIPQSTGLPINEEALKEVNKYW
jgi:hypothetical protein